MLTSTLSRGKGGAMKRRDFLKSATGAAAWTIAPAALSAQAAARPGGAWHQRPLRIYHPNAREFELRTLDVKRFVADCKATGAEAIVVSAGGVYAFYPSKVKYHHVSPISGKRDLLGETMEEARRQNVRVIARVDFAKAREEVWKDHPEWFRRDAKGNPMFRDGYYATCAMGGYRNEEFAYRVIQEILERYRVDGFHLNAGGFGYCYCQACAKTYEGTLPVDREKDPAAWRKFLRWRQEAISRQLAGYYRLMRELNPGSFFMAELGGQESPAWALTSGYHLPSLVRFNSFSQLLFTSGEMETSRDSRLWVALTADHGLAVGGHPLINIKMQMRDLRLSQAYMPPAEFLYCAYQALAHGAGLKLVTLAIPERVLDSRTLPDLKQVFTFMRQQQPLFDMMQPVSQVALVWPESALLEGSAMEGKAAAALRSEALGLYTGLKMRHAALGLLYDEQISPERLRGYDAVVLTTAVWLSEEQAATLASYVETGGRLVLFDSPVPEAASFGRMPRPLAALLGGTWTQNAKKARYTARTAQAPPPPLQGAGPVLPLTEPFREVKPGRQAQVWYKSAHSDDASAPEDIDELTIGEDPIVLFARAGKGSVFYVATGLGQMIQQIGHVDYITMLETLVYHGLGKPRPLVTNAPSTVTATLARWKDGQVVQLVNGTGPAPLDAVIPVGPIELELAWSGPARAELVAPGRVAQPLPHQAKAGRLLMTVPRLEAYAQVVVRSV